MNPSLLFSRTEELLFVCARAQGHALRRDKINSLIKRGVDFEYLRLLAVNHHVSSLVYNALKFYAPSSSADEEAIKGLRVSSLASLAANSFYKKELIRILTNLAEKDIPVIPLKGIFLSEYLYGDVQSRDQSVDVDLLVREQDVARVTSALEALGYALRPAGETEKYLWSRSFVKPGMPAIDLHWDITMMVRSRERIDSLWRAARSQNVPILYYYFGPEELLLYLSAHLVNSGAFRQLRHIRDVEHLIEKYGSEINWNSVVRKSRRWRLSGSLYASLILIRQSSGRIFPAKVLRELKISFPKRLFIRFFADKKVVMGNGFRRRLLDVFFSYILFEIAEAASPEDYFNIFKRVFLPPKETMEGAGYCMRIIKGAVKLVGRIAVRYE